MARAQDMDTENLIWEARLEEFTAFALEFVRGFDQPVRRFFRTPGSRRRIAGCR